MQPRTSAERAFLTVEGLEDRSVPAFMFAAASPEPFPPPEPEPAPAAESSAETAAPSQGRSGKPASVINSLSATLNQLAARVAGAAPGEHASYLGDVRDVLTAASAELTTLADRVAEGYSDLPPDTAAAAAQLLRDIASSLDSVAATYGTMAGRVAAMSGAELDAAAAAASNHIADMAGTADAIAAAVADVRAGRSDVLPGLQAAADAARSDVQESQAVLATTE